MQASSDAARPRIPIETVLLILVVVALTSAVAWTTCVRERRGKDLVPALLRTVEGLGFTIMFLALNLVIGFLIVRALWILTGYFVSVYVLEDSALLVLSAVQGFAFRWWLDRCSA